MLKSDVKHMNGSEKFHPLIGVEDQNRPKKFTFPFYYEPHPWAIAASEDLQRYLQYQNDFDHNFGLDPDQKGLAIGKMFGVLLVENSQGQLGYFAAVSGKLADTNHHAYFVPPVYDMLVDGDWFRMGEQELISMSEQLDSLLSDPIYQHDCEQIAQLEAHAEQSIQQFKALTKASKKARDQHRQAHPTHAEHLRKQSLFYQYSLRDLTQFWEQKLQIIRSAIEGHESEIAHLRKSRRDLSHHLQKRLFEQYTFLNARGESAALRELFDDPPSGAGECAAPKLLHFAYTHGYTPLALAEFWWGAPPKSALRRHQHYYPACRSKCLPILTHMLQGLDTDPNPLLDTTSDDLEIDIIYEDDYMAVINKPAEMLSAPGIHIKDCVQARMKKRYPQATGPLIVHRLDMSTSGIMLIARNLDTYRTLQQGFVKHHIQKRYTAILEGTIPSKEGHIDLPLRVDLDDRPRQLVCYEHGKAARTRYQVIDVRNGRSRIHFYPITGRTHQLRVHAAHPSGLGSPIVGDDLYGTRDQRLHLHADQIDFIHPHSGEKIHIECPAPF